MLTKNLCRYGPMLDIWDMMMRGKRKKKKFLLEFRIKLTKYLKVLTYNDISFLLVKLHCMLGKTAQKRFSF